MITHRTGDLQAPLRLSALFFVMVISSLMVDKGNLRPSKAALAIQKLTISLGDNNLFIGFFTP